MTPARSMNCGQAAAPDQGHGAIRAASKEDLEDIITVHQRAFANSFLTQLGHGFLRRYYALVLSYRGGILLIMEGPARVEGFACGFVDPEGFYGLMRQRKGFFALPILVAIARCPSLAGKIVHGIQRVERQKPRANAGCCELSSLAVRPESGGRGIGGALVHAFLEVAWSLSAQSVLLRTDSQDNEPANALYHKVGFQLCGRYQQYKGRWMNEYVIDHPRGGVA
jgi:ribosomal protein S18 acetylase RimI-like enzyme